MAFVRILLTEDHTIVRNGIKSILNSDSSFSVVGEASNGREALSLLNSGLEADVLLTDLAMPEMDGLELSRQIKAN